MVEEHDVIEYGQTEKRRKIRAAFERKNESKQCKVRDVCIAPGRHDVVCVGRHCGGCEHLTPSEYSVMRSSMPTVYEGDNCDG